MICGTRCVSICEGDWQMKFSGMIRRLFALALVVALLAGISTVGVAFAEKSNYYCTANRVNVRSGPSSSNASIGKLMKGDVVSYIGKSNGWYKVSFYDKKSHTSVNGYVYRKYLSAVAPSKSSGSSISTTTTYKTTVNLRVRSEPSITSGYVRTKLKSGTKVSVVKQKKSWVYVTYKGGSGWVSAKYLKKVYKK